MKEEVEYYVEEWEAGVPVDSFYESDFETDSDTEATQSTPHKTRLRLNPPARPTEGTSSTTTATRNRSRPQSQASSSGSSDDSGDDDSEASMHDNNNDVPQSTGAPNFYNADKNTHIFINVDPDNDLPENILAENILPLEPPSYLSDKNVTVYERLFERTLFCFPSIKPPHYSHHQALILDNSRHRTVLSPPDGVPKAQQQPGR